MERFHKLRVLDKTFETDDCVLLTLGVETDDAETFRYTQGQHLPLRAEIGGKSIRRTYSICSSVNDRRLRLGVRVQPEGVFSNYVADDLSVGDLVDAMPPNGHFNTPLDSQQKKTYVAFVAGSGITPMLSVIKTTMETEPGSRFVVFYGNRKRSSTMFIDELWSLKNLYRERLSLHFIMSQEPGEIALYEGRIDGKKTSILVEAFLSELTVDEFFICGPNPMIDGVTEALVDKGYAPERIHSERFRANMGKAAADARARIARPDGEGDVEVAFVMDGNRQTVRMGSDETVLDAALRKGIDAPYSCRGGVCSTCRAKLTKGEAEMALNYALEPWELEQGFILTCQAVPKSGELEIDYDQT